MLEEAWHWLWIRASAEARRLGYRAEAAALRARHRRCRAAWASHLAATRAALLHSAERAARREMALVLGAGLLRDIPWDRLLERFARLVLVDVVFHPECLRMARERADRVQLLVCDVTGCLNELTRQPRHVPERWDIPAALRAAGEQADWIASVNLLTQAPLLPCAWLLRHGANEAMVEDFGQALMQAHLRWLCGLAGEVCLIAEVRDHLWSDQGSVEHMEREAFVRAALAPRQSDGLGRWHWQVNPPGELAQGAWEVRELLGLHLSAL